MPVEALYRTMGLAGYWIASVSAMAGCDRSDRSRQVQSYSRNVPRETKHKLFAVVRRSPAPPSTVTANSGTPHDLSSI